MTDPARTGFDVLLGAVADRVREQAPRPFLSGTGGRPALGKSTLAQWIARSATADRRGEISTEDCGPWLPR